MPDAAASAAGSAPPTSKQPRAGPARVAAVTTTPGVELLAPARFSLVTQTLDGVNGATRCKPVVPSPFGTPEPPTSVTPSHASHRAAVTAMGFQSDAAAAPTLISSLRPNPASTSRTFSNGGFRRPEPFRKFAPYMLQAQSQVRPTLTAHTHAHLTRRPMTDFVGTPLAFQTGSCKGQGECQGAGRCSRGSD